MTNMFILRYDDAKISGQAMTSQMSSINYDVTFTPQTHTENELPTPQNPPSKVLLTGTESYGIIHFYEFQVALLYKKKSFCGGSIISDRVVLTAAHCTDGMTPEALTVKIGDHDLTQNDVSRERAVSVRKIIQHDGYDSISMNNDISLVFLTSKLTLTWRVAPLCLTPYDVTYYKEQVLVMGWGLTSEGDKESGSPVLLQAKVKGKCFYVFVIL
ncbi:serine protease 55-like [Penaeus indicus]|uniref:serine protease 55-like n=1 Tax=Penaeus indicus TaxID=29960 RepID=UPI00300C637D